MTNTPKDAAEIATRLHRLTGLTQNQIDSLSLSLDPIQVDQINDSDLASLANGTLPGLPANPSGGLPLGLPGATAATRWVGGTASVAPTSGSFLIGDWVVGRNGTFWVCTTAGSPGTWTQATGGGGGGAVSSVAGRTGAVTLTATDVGLANVNNTADSAKPVSTAQAAAIAALQTTPTAVKTGAYTAAVGDLVRVDTTSAAVTVTLPAAPADKSVIGVRHEIQGGTNAVTIARGGSSDVFNKVGGSTSLSMPTVNQTMLLQYQSSTGIWYVRDSLSLAVLDARYAAFGSGGGSGLPATILTKTANYTAAVGDFVLANATSAGFTVTLPSAPGIGALVTVKKTDSSANVVTIAPAGGGTIDGDANATITSKSFGAVLEHVGSNAWQIVAPTTSNAGPTGATGATGATGPTGATGQGVPTGGTTGQSLVKTSNTDFATGWSTVSGGGGSSVARGRPLGGGVTYWTVPGAHPVSQQSGGVANNRMYYEPVYVTTDQTIGAIALQVSAAVAGGLARVGVYTADVNWQPVALVAELTSSTQIDCSSTGQHTLTVSQTLLASQGRYLFAINFNNASMSLSQLQCAHDYSGFVPGTGIVTGWYVASTYGAMPSTPVPWTTVVTGNTGFNHLLTTQISTP